MNVYLIRHAETAWSLTGQHTGLTDLPLTARGEDQARALAPRLLALDLKHVLVSPRQRASQTCALAELGDVAVVEPDLSEWIYGDFEGLRSVDIRKENPSWNIWQDGCPGGESPAEASARADRLISHVRTLQGSVALFSHGQFGAAFVARWVGFALIEGQHFVLRPASICMLGYDENHPDRPTLEW